jgi:hypothetical protein
LIAANFRESIQENGIGGVGDSPADAGQARADAGRRRNAYPTIHPTHRIASLPVYLQQMIEK